MADSHDQPPEMCSCEKDTEWRAWGSSRPADSELPRPQRRLVHSRVAAGIPAQNVLVVGAHDLGEGRRMRRAATRPMRRIAPEDLGDLPEPILHEMLLERFEQLRGFDPAGGAVRFDESGDVWTHPPTPHRALMVGGVALLGISVVKAPEVGMPGVERPQAHGRRQLLADHTHDALGAFAVEERERQADGQDLVRADGRVRTVESTTSNRHPAGAFQNTGRKFSSSRSAMRPKRAMSLGIEKRSASRSMIRRALYHSAFTSTGLPPRCVTGCSPTRASIHVSARPGSPQRSMPSLSTRAPARVPSP